MQNFSTFGESPAFAHIVVYGIHSPDWMSALAPNAPVWDKLSEVKSVLSVADNQTFKIEQFCLGDRIIVIPLMEKHIQSCPRQYATLIPDEISVQILADKAAFAAYAKNHHLDGLIHPLIFSNDRERLSQGFVSI